MTAPAAPFWIGTVSRAEASSSPAWAAPVNPTVEERSSTSAAPAPPRAAATFRAARGDVPDTAAAVISPTGMPACLRASVRAAWAGSTRIASAKRSSQARAVGSDGSRHLSRSSSVAPAAATSSATTMRGDTPSPPGSPAPAVTKATAPSPLAASSVPPGRPVRTSDSTTSVGSARSRPARSAPIPERTAPPRS